jgi:hypothetical protein
MAGGNAAKAEDSDWAPGQWVCVFKVDDVTYRYEHPFITGAETWTASILRDQGLVLIHEDGSQETRPKTASPRARPRLPQGPTFQVRLR